MATQFSLSYDSAGNASLVENKITSKPAITGKFDIDPYEPIRTVSTDYTFTDPFDYDNQLVYLQQYINDNDADIDDDDGPDILAKDKLTVAQRQTVENLKKAGLFKEAEDFEKTAKGLKTAEGFKTVAKGASLFGISNPAIAIGSIFASVYTYSAEKKQSEIIDSYFESDYFQNMAKQMDYEYAAYNDYDAYNDIVDFGPMYTRDDVKVGTYFDAEDHGEPPSDTGTSGFDYESDAYGTSSTPDYSNVRTGGPPSQGGGGGPPSRGGGADMGGGSPGSSGPGGSDEMGSF
tara:strand:- start:48 stop:917 length:870 start_codon:yes stop_codon:yes gene_type:complete